MSLGLAWWAKRRKPKAPNVIYLVWAVWCAAAAWKAKLPGLPADLRSKAPASLSHDLLRVRRVSRSRKLNPADSVAHRRHGRQWGIA